MATTAPGPHAQHQEADDKDDPHRLPERGGEVADGKVDHRRLVGNQDRLDPDGQVRGRPAPWPRSRPRPVPGCRRLRAIEIASAMARLPFTRRSGCGGSTSARRTVAMSPSRIVRPSATSVTSSTSVSDVKAPETRRARFSVPELIDARRPHHVLRRDGVEDLAVVEAHGRHAVGLELDQDLFFLHADPLDLADPVDLGAAGRSARRRRGRAARGRRSRRR